jgi:hypothetical protein
MWRTWTLQAKSVHLLKYPSSVLPSAARLLHRAERDHLHRLASSNPVLVKSDAQRQTIYALSTPPGKAGIAVVRVSGPDALHVWQSMVIPYSSAANPEPWKMERCRITHPLTNQILDDALAVFFKGKHWVYL